MENDQNSGKRVKGSIDVSPSMKSVIGSIRSPHSSAVMDERIIKILIVAFFLGIAGGLVAELFIYLIKFINTLSFYGTLSADHLEPSVERFGFFIVFIPVIGGLIVGFMAYYWSKGIRGDGIPEAMEHVLAKGSNIPARMSFLKPISSSIAIGTGGPFGAEGPIIATGSAIGSLFGQYLKITDNERKTLLAAGAAAGIAATFGSPVAGILLAIELLLFEFNPRSVVPVAMASIVATAVRITIHGVDPIFHMPSLPQPSDVALAVYLLLGGVIGVASVVVTWSIYFIEDLFEKLPIHWKWWPAIGGIAVGIIGYISPHTMGVGYDVIDDILSGHIIGNALIILFFLKFLSWSISLGSTTSGGTLAPIFVIGGGLGAALCGVLNSHFPGLGVDPRLAGLIGMAALFGGAARAMLTSAVFAFETTLQPHALLPLLGGCTAAYLVSSLLMKQSIMTKKIVRKGIRVPVGIEADILDQILVREVASYGLVTLKGDMTLGDVNTWLNSIRNNGTHQGFPAIDDEGNLLGVVTRRDLFAEELNPHMKISELIKRPPVVVYEDNSLRDAVDIMAEESVGRLPVVVRSNPRKVRAILTRSDILKAHGRHLHQVKMMERKRSFFNKKIIGK